jgi:hypothetical protein
MTSRWSIGNAEFDRLEVALLSAPAAEDGYDWIACRATVRAGGFSGAVDLMMLGSELRAFRSDLDKACRELRGTVALSTLEEQLHLSIAVYDKGHVTASGYVKESPANGAELRFTLDLDQTHLQHTIAELDEALRHIAG